MRAVRGSDTECTNGTFHSRPRTRTMDERMKSRGNWTIMIRRMACLAGLIWILGAIPAQAACSGSGQAFSCPAGGINFGRTECHQQRQRRGGHHSHSRVVHLVFNRIIFSIQGSDTDLRIRAGLYHQSSGYGKRSGTSIDHRYELSFLSSQWIRFQFTSSSPIPTGVIWFGYAGNSNGVLTQVRIDNNSFTNFSEGSIAIFFGDNDSPSTSYGVIDHNTLNSSGAVTLLQMIGSVQTSPAPSPIGTVNNMFVEDNTINWAQPSSASVGGCMDSWGDARIVWRHNTSTNCLVSATELLTRVDLATSSFITTTSS